MAIRRNYLAVLVTVLGMALAAPALAELDQKKWEDLAAKAEAAAKKGSANEAGDLLAQLCRDDSERAARVICSVFARIPGENEYIYEKTFEALTAMTNAKAYAQMKRELATAKDWRLRVLLVDVLGAKGRQHEDALIPALKDKEEEVVRAAARHIGRFRSEAGIYALCDAMTAYESKKRTGATWQDLRNALMRALGIELAGGADYRNYFDANKAKFVIGRGIPPDPSKAKDDRDGGSGRVGETVVFGTELYCKNVVIIVDCSGSMDISDPYPPGMDLGSLSREYVESNGVKDPERNRMFRARKEVSKLLEGLARAKGKANIIAYSTSVSLWKPEGLHDISANLANAKAFVEGLKPDGVTSTDIAISTAFDIAPDADCYYLISDGKATHDGQVFIPAARIIYEVEKRNRLRKVQINTFGFIAPNTDQVADVPLMTGLAEMTGGTYTEIR
jgi:hypothetical protein